MSNKRNYSIKYRKRRRQRQLIIVSFFTLSFIISVLISIKDIKQPLYNTKISNDKWIETTSEDELAILQNFKTKEKSISGISIYLSYAGKNKDGKLILEILSEKGKLLGQSSIDYDDIKENKFSKIKLKENITLKKGSTYFIRLSQKSAKKGQGLSYYYTEDNNSKHQFKEASVTKNGCLVINVLTHRFSVLSFILCLIVILTIVIAFRVFISKFD